MSKALKAGSYFCGMRNAKFRIASCGFRIPHCGFRSGLNRSAQFGADSAFNIPYSAFRVAGSALPFLVRIPHAKRKKIK